MDIFRRYAVEPAGNGGCIVYGESDTSSAAFTTPADMLAWLAEQYGVKSTVEVTVSGDKIAERAAPTIPPMGPPFTKWDGSDMLKANRDRPCMILMRDGSERAGKTCDVAARWAWKYGAHTTQDVVGYRYV